MATKHADKGKRKHWNDLNMAASQAMTVNRWWQAGHFATREEARGAFEFAHQQYMDGMGRSEREWLGIEGSWRGDNLPPLKSRDVRRSIEQHENVRALIDALASESLQRLLGGSGLLKYLPDGPLTALRTGRNLGIVCKALKRATTDPTIRAVVKKLVR